ncbi:MAG: pyrroline-5-carboxylate reductase [Fibrobacterota bacterium]
MFKGTLALLGCGNMGAALIRGAVGGGFPAGQIRLVDPDAAKVAELTNDGIGASATLEEAFGSASVVILAVKPQIFPSLAIRIGQLLPENALVISIMAGVTVRRIRELMGRPEQHVARLMPNLPLTVGAGASAVATGGLSAEDLELVRALFRPTGSLAEVPESQLDAVTGLSGSGPAYVLKFLMSLEDGGVLSGLPRPVARELALATIEGTCKLLRESGLEPDALRGMVTSPGGTTIHGLQALEKGGFGAAVADAVYAATRRSQELGG